MEQPRRNYLDDIVAERLGDGALPPVLEPKSPTGGGFKWMVVAIIALAVAGGAGAAIWSLTSDTEQLRANADVPVIKADGTPVKTRPEEPGGMDVPNRDKLVYERLAAGEGLDGPERLLPLPEAPVQPPVLADAAPADPAPAANEVLTPLPAPSAEMPVAVVPAPEPVPAPVPAPVPEPEPAPVAEAAPAAEPAPAPAAEPAPARPTAAQAEAPKPEPAKPAPEQQAEAVAPAAAGAWLIQLGAFRDEASVAREWDRLQKANADILGGLSLNVQKADLGAKGVFYRLRAGGLAEASARKLCTDLGARKLGCMVVKP